MASQVPACSPFASGDLDKYMLWLLSCETTYRIPPLSFQTPAGGGTGIETTRPTTLPTIPDGALAASKATESAGYTETAKSADAYRPIIVFSTA